MDFNKLKPKLKKPKVFGCCFSSSASCHTFQKVLGTRLQLVTKRDYEKIEPFDPALVKDALKFTSVAPTIAKKPKTSTTVVKSTSSTTKPKSAASKKKKKSSAKEPATKKPKK